jgi:hypothetical protein
MTSTKRKRTVINLDDDEQESAPTETSPVYQKSNAALAAMERIAKVNTKQKKTNEQINK